MSTKSMQVFITPEATPESTHELETERRSYTVEVTPARDGNYGYVKKSNGLSEPAHGEWNITLKRKTRDEIMLRMDDGLDDDQRCLPFQVSVPGAQQLPNPFRISKAEMEYAEGSWGSVVHPVDDDEVYTFQSGICADKPKNGGKTKLFSCLRLSAALASGNNSGERTVLFNVKVVGYKEDDPELELEC